MDIDMDYYFQTIEQYKLIKHPKTTAYVAFTQEYEGSNTILNWVFPYLHLRKMLKLPDELKQHLEFKKMNPSRSVILKSSHLVITDRFDTTTKYIKKTKNLQDFLNGFEKLFDSCAVIYEVSYQDYNDDGTEVIPPDNIIKNYTSKRSKPNKKPKNKKSKSKSTKPQTQDLIKQPEEESTTTDDTDSTDDTSIDDTESIDLPMEITEHITPTGKSLWDNEKPLDITQPKQVHIDLKRVILLSNCNIETLSIYDYNIFWLPYIKLSFNDREIYSNTEKYNIIQMIHNCFNTNDKFNKILKSNTHLRIVKPLHFDNQLTMEGEHFNIILYNSHTNVRSFTYHVYVNNNSIIDMTRAEVIYNSFL